jgi:hypothetical protein
MPYQVRWQLVGHSGRPLDHGDISEAYEGYSEAVEAIHEFLRPYPEVKHCHEEGYWLARRSQDADLVVWVWIEQYDHPEDRILEVATPMALALAPAAQ